MRHILVLNSKGGSGKTTIATGLASYYASQGKNVALVDYDPQASSMAWLSARSAARPPIEGISAAKHPGQRVKRSTEYVIMDAPAALHGAAMSNIVRKAETILVPVLPSYIDMRAASDFLKEIMNSAPVSKKKAKLALVANRSRDYTNIYWELDEFLENQKIPFLTMLRDSQNYIRAAEKGLGIFEMAPGATAVDREQWEPIIEWIQNRRSRP